MRIAYPLDLFDRNVTDGRMMIVSFLTLVIGNNQGMGDIEHAKIYDFYMPERAIQLFDGLAKDISDMWRILGRPIKDGGYIAGTIIKPKLGLRPEPFAKAAYQFWLGGDFIKNDEPQGNQVFAPLKKVVPLVYDAMKRAEDEPGQAKSRSPAARLGFTTNLVQNAPQGYSGAPVPGLRITGDVFPLAFNKKNRSFTRNLGVTGLFDRAIKISSELKTAAMTYTLPTVEQHLAFGVIYRHPVSPTLTIEGSVRYNKRKFVINKSSAPMDAVDIPNTDYSYVDPGVGVHYVLGPKAALSADARFLLITDTGEMQSPDQYGASPVAGVDLAVAVDYLS